jgi:hypothetical protein
LFFCSILRCREQLIQCNTVSRRGCILIILITDTSDESVYPLDRITTYSPHLVTHISKKERRKNIWQTSSQSNLTDLREWKQQKSRKFKARRKENKSSFRSWFLPNKISCLCKKEKSFFILSRDFLPSKIPLITFYGWCCIVVIIIITLTIGFFSFIFSETESTVVEEDEEPGWCGRVKRQGERSHERTRLHTLFSSLLVAVHLFSRLFILMSFNSKLNLNFLSLWVG